MGVHFVLLVFLLPSADAFRIVPRERTSACAEHAVQSARLTSETLLRYGAAVRLSRSLDDKSRAEAARLLTQLAKDAPWFAQAHYGLGHAHAAREALIPAYLAFKHYLQFDVHPNDRDDVRTSLATLESKEPLLATYAKGERAAIDGKWPDAARLAQEVVAAKPSFSLAHRLLAASYAATGRAEQAIASYEAYLDLDELAVDRDVVRRIIADTKAALRERAAHAQRP